MTAFKMIRKQRQWPERGKQKSWALRVAQLNTLKEFSGHGTGKEESRRRPADSTIWREKSLGKPKQLEFTRQTIRGKKQLQREKALETCRGYSSRNQLRTEHTHVSKLPMQGKEPPESFRGISALSSAKPKIVRVPTSQIGKTPDSWTTT